MRSRPALLLLVASGALSLAPAGCRRAPDRPSIAYFAVSESPALGRLGSAGLVPEDVRKSAADGFTAAFGAIPAKPVVPAGNTPFRARVTVLFAHVLADSGPGDTLPSPAGKVEVGVEVELAPGFNQPPLRESAQWAERVDPVEGLVPALRRAVAGATRKGADALLLAWNEERKSDVDLLRDLEAGDARVRDHAVRVLADRKNPAAVPALISRLQDPDGEVVERAIGALAQLRDPRAVEPLIDLSQRREATTVAQLARIIGDIGGPEAEAYLVTLASGHPEPTVRQAAEAALADMRGRATPAVAGSKPPAP